MGLFSISQQAANLDPFLHKYLLLVSLAKKQQS